MLRMAEPTSVRAAAPMAIEVTVESGGEPVRTIGLEVDGPVWIGRAETCQVRLDSDLVSRRHAMVTLEPESHAFAVQNLIAHVRLNQIVQLGGGWFATFRGHMLCHEVVYHSLRDDDAAPAGVRGSHPSIAGEERDADDEEVQQRLGENCPNTHVTSANTRSAT